MITIRPARRTDAEAISRIYVEGWQDAYPGLLPDDLLLGMGKRRGRVESWERTIRRGIGEKVFVATETLSDGTGVVLGFASGGRARRGGLDHAGEIYTLYVDPAHHGRGIGRALLGTLALELASTCGKSLIVWVLAGNPARYFYEAQGGRFVGTRAERVGGAPVDEIAFGWPDASIFAARQGEGDE